MSEEERWGRSVLHDKQERLGEGGTYKCKYSGLFLNCLGPNDLPVDCFTGLPLEEPKISFQIRDPHNHAKTLGVSFNTPPETAEGNAVIQQALGMQIQSDYPRGTLNNLAVDRGLLEVKEEDPYEKLEQLAKSQPGTEHADYIPWLKAINRVRKEITRIKARDKQVRPK